MGRQLHHHDVTVIQHKILLWLRVDKHHRLGKSMINTNMMLTMIMRIIREFRGTQLNNRFHELKMTPQAQSYLMMIHD